MPFGTHNLTFLLTITIFLAYFLVICDICQCRPSPSAAAVGKGSDEEESDKYLKLAQKFQKLAILNDLRQSRGINSEDNNNNSSDFNSTSESEALAPEHHEELHEEATTEDSHEDSENSTTTGHLDESLPTIVHGHGSDNGHGHGHGIHLDSNLTDDERKMLKSERLESWSGKLLAKIRDVIKECVNGSEDECFSNWANCPENIEGVIDCSSNLTWGDACDPMMITDKNKIYSGPWNDTCFTSTWAQEDSDPRKVLECSLEDKRCRCFGDESDISRKLDHPGYNSFTETCKIPLHHRCIPSKTECDNKWHGIKIRCLTSTNKHAYLHEDKSAHFCLTGNSLCPQVAIILLLVILTRICNYYNT